MTQLESYERPHCANCGAVMNGEFCHECGQSMHSVLKPLHHMVEETVETVLHIDGRIVHTLPPLLLKPGFLTLEYFAGRRVRYIAPFRLMFVLCLLSFFVVHLAVDQFTDTAVPSDLHPLVIQTDNAAIERADTAAEVRHALQKELDGLQAARDLGVLPQSVHDQTLVAERELRRKASQRLVALGAAPLSAASLAAPAAAATVSASASASAGSTVGARTGNTVRKALRHEPRPVQLSWLPDAANARLTAMGRRVIANWQAFLEGDPATRAEAGQRMLNGVFSALPPTMFLLMPMFAALLKLLYLFRRRLYMEHLIVALHSHAFIFLSLLLITLAGMLSMWLRAHAAWASHALTWLQTLLLLWVPVYLLIMQKRVYRQGWPMTLLKFWLAGWFYCWLLMVALMIAAALGMAR